MRFITAKDFGALVRDARRKAQLTQAELAAASNTGERFIRELEKGKPTLQLEKALWVAQMLGIRFDAQLPASFEKKDMS